MCCQSSCLVQSKGCQSRIKLATACLCVSTDSRFRRCWCMSSGGNFNIPLTTLRPKLLLNCVSSSITWTNPLFKPNSTWKYGKSFGIEDRNPFTLVSMSFLALCWLHSSSASSIAYSEYLLKASVEKNTTTMTLQQIGHRRKGKAQVWAWMEAQPRVPLVLYA